VLELAKRFNRHRGCASTVAMLDGASAVIFTMRDGHLFHQAHRYGEAAYVIFAHIPTPLLQLSEINDNVCSLD
jgi:hypothetical protein